MNTLSTAISFKNTNNGSVITHAFDFNDYDFRSIIEDYLGTNFDFDDELVQVNTVQEANELIKKHYGETEYTFTQVTNVHDLMYLDDAVIAELRMGGVESLTDEEREKIYNWKQEVLNMYPGAKGVYLTAEEEGTSINTCDVLKWFTTNTRLTVVTVL